MGGGGNVVNVHNKRYYQITFTSKTLRVLKAYIYNFMLINSINTCNFIWINIIYETYKLISIYGIWYKQLYINNMLIVIYIYIYVYIINNI